MAEIALSPEPLIIVLAYHPLAIELYAWWSLSVNEGYNCVDRGEDRFPEEVASGWQSGGKDREPMVRSRPRIQPNMPIKQFTHTLGER